MKFINKLRYIIIIFKYMNLHIFFYIFYILKNFIFLFIITLYLTINVWYLY
jgi:hypothetical protein